MRRVVVTGLGAITPLGANISTTWRRLLQGESGIVGLPSTPRWAGLPSRIAGLVPRRAPGSSDMDAWDVNDWLPPAEARRMALFAQYAVAAGEMAFRDAGWRPRTAREREECGVCLGSGIGNLDGAYETSVAFHENVHTLLVCKVHADGNRGIKASPRSSSQRYY